MSVNDISGFPILEVTSDDTVKMGTWNADTLVVTGSLVGIRNSSPTTELSVSGSISASGDITASAFSGDGSQITGVVSSSYALTSSFATSASWSPAGGGNVSNTGTPANDQVAVWTDATTIEGTSGLTYNGSTLTVVGGVTSDGIQVGPNETIKMGGTLSYQLFHDGTNNIIRSNESDLLFQDSSTTRIRLYRTTGNISASGDITASAFSGDGSQITGVVSSSYASTSSYIEGFVNFEQGIVVTGSLIASGGLSGIGEPNPSYDWDVNGIVRADTYYWDTAAPQQTPSDSRLKTNVTPLPPQSERIRDVNLVEFEWSELNDTRPSRQNRIKRQGTKDVGVIAQEIQEIFPELVSEDADGYLTVSYVGLLIPLIKTVQEQQKQIDELKKLISGDE
jgi:hypothetical protein